MERERDRETETERQTETDRQTETETNREREGGGGKKRKEKIINENEIRSYHFLHCTYASISNLPLHNYYVVSFLPASEIIV